MLYSCIGMLRYFIKLFVMSIVQHSVCGAELKRMRDRKILYLFSAAVFFFV